MHRARRLGIAAMVLFFSSIALNVLSTATSAAIEPSIHAADYNRVNTGAHPVTASMVYPNDTTWKDPLVECLIITNQTFVAAFQPLADLKTGRGVYTIILSTQSIYADIRFNTSGSDSATRIRNAIKHYHDVNGTEFVILGGDVGIIPTRYVYNPDTAENAFPIGSLDYRNLYKPTDHYYAGLEGTWDTDGDGKFGEMGIVGTSVDEVDWTAEVYVGRIPANTVPQVQTMVQKILDYETSPPAGSWLNTAVFAGAVSQYENPVEGSPSVDEAELSEFMIDSYFSATANNRIYQVSTSYSPPSPYTTLTTVNLRSAWNLGSSIINLAGHGSPDTFGGYAPSYTTYITESVAKTLTNGGKLPLAYIFSCSSGAFDYKELTSVSNSLSEELMLNANGGAIAVVSAIRTTFYFTIDPLFEALNEGQNRFFWREFMVNNEYQPGRALYLSQESYIDQFIDKYWNVELNHDPKLASDPDYLGEEEKFRKNLLAYNLLGDPEISVYTNVPKTFSASIIGQNASIGDTLVMGITDDAGMPVPNARVLVNGSGYYIVARANALGIVSVRIPHDSALIGQSLNVTLSGHNMNVSRGTILVIDDTLAPVSLQVDVPSGDVDYRGTLRINAIGTDLGSGLRYAFIVIVDETGSPTAIHDMTRTRIEGNSTSFEFKYPGALPPGETITFYVIAFDASGNYIIATPAMDQLYVVTITSRLVEDVMLGVIVIGIPVVAVVIVIWFIMTRRKRRNSVINDTPSQILTNQPRESTVTSGIRNWIQYNIPDAAVQPVLAVPTDYSSAISQIPPDHEVIYSTTARHSFIALSTTAGSILLLIISLSFVISFNWIFYLPWPYDFFRNLFFMVILGVFFLVTAIGYVLKRYNTHLLMTSQGIAGYLKSKNKYEYIPWYRIPIVENKRIAFSPSRYFSIQRDARFEDVYAYKKRVAEFLVFLAPHVIASKRAYLQSPQSQYLSQRKKRVEINRLNKLISDCIKQADKLGLPRPNLQ